MKVSSVELKTRLGHYLREVELSGQSIEVCVRDRPVAILMALETVSVAEGEGKGNDAIRERLALERVGMSVEPSSVRGLPPDIRPALAGDGRSDIPTVETMRAERDW